MVFFADTVACQFRPVAIPLEVGTNLILHTREPRYGNRVTGQKCINGEGISTTII